MSWALGPFRQPRRLQPPHVQSHRIYHGGRRHPRGWRHPRGSRARGNDRNGVRARRAGLCGRRACANANPRGDDGRATANPSRRQNRGGGRANANPSQSRLGACARQIRISVRGFSSCACHAGSYRKTHPEQPRGHRPQQHRRAPRPPSGQDDDERSLLLLVVLFPHGVEPRSGWWSASWQASTHGSVSFRCLLGLTCEAQRGRPALAMQKVECSRPFSRSQGEPCSGGPFCRLNPLSTRTHVAPAMCLPRERSLQECE